MCSLFSPMDAFADQHGARIVARLARAALLDPATDDDAPKETALRAPLSRRDLLRGRFRRSEDGHRG
jgi:NiFe hydrogenase assembly chaperone HybE-like protein